MPKCPNCGNSARSYELRVVSDTLVCHECARPKAVEDSMLSDKKRLVSFALNEIPTPDNALDHEIEFEGGYGGLEIKFNTTFDRVRTFFTKQREKGKKAELKTLK